MIGVELHTATLEKESLVELLFRVQTGHCSCRAAADIILKLVDEQRKKDGVNWP